MGAVPARRSSVSAAVATGGFGGVRPASAYDEMPLLAVPEPLAGVFLRGGLRPGSVVAVSGARSLLMALLAGVGAGGGWCATVGLPDLGAAAAAELGIPLDRLACVPRPGARWAAVVGALLGAVDAVAVGPGAPVRAGEARRLAARAREGGSALLVEGGVDGADVRLSVQPGGWVGLARGQGRLAARQVVVRAEGKGVAGRVRSVRLWLPGPDGGIAPADELATGGMAPVSALPGAVAAAV